MKDDVPADRGSIKQDAVKVSNVTFLSPVWGRQFSGRFLEFCLPTLLSPNNIPAVARELPSRFILLTRENDEQAIVSHPAWQRLAELCAVEILRIDDLVTDGHHTSTITLGFERALRRSGQSMRNTCFIFLMSDYLVADGSLATVLATVQKGARAVLVGNFQIVAEDASPPLRDCFASSSSEIVLRPRELVKFSLEHLHPATIANIVNLGLTHNAHCNRLFWQVDEETFIGRFYLMHPIAICPEVDDFSIGSSWDYSFIPELCPSGNIATLTDSDEYLVVEMQHRYYEHEHLRPGPFGVQELALSLSEWTTAQHRHNVERTLVFHGGELPTNLTAVAASSDAFVSDLTKLAVSSPMAHRDHPYWIGSVAAHRRDACRPLDRDDWRVVLAAQSPDRGLRLVLRHLEERLLGWPLDVTKLHPLWPDYRLAAKAFRRIFDSNRRALLIVRKPAQFGRWVLREAGAISTLSPASLLQMPRAIYLTLIGTFDTVLLILDENSLVRCDTLIAYAAPLLAHGGTCNLLLVNRRPFATASEFGRVFTREVARLWRPRIQICDIQYTKCGPLRMFMRGTFGKLRRRIAIGSPVASCVALVASLLLPAVYLANRTVKCTRTPPSGIWSSVFVSLRIAETAAGDLPLLGGKEDQSARAMLSASVRKRFPFMC